MRESEKDFCTERSQKDVDINSRKQSIEDDAARLQLFTTIGNTKNSLS